MDTYVFLLVGLGLDLSRVDLDDVFSGRVSGAKGIPLGVEVLTDTFHNLQDQSFLFLRKNKFTQCFTDSIMRYVAFVNCQVSILVNSIDLGFIHHELSASLYHPTRVVVRILVLLPIALPILQKSRVKFIRGTVLNT